MMAAEIERARDALHHIPADLPRDEWVRVLMAGQAAGLNADELRTWSEGGSTYNARDFADTMRSIKPGRGVGAGTLFYEAAAHGWRDGDKPQQRSPSKAVIRPPEPPRKPRPGMAPADVLERCEAATCQHAYIQRKAASGVPVDSLRVLPADDALRIGGESMAGALVVPAYAADGSLQSLQLIPPQGKKMNLPGCPMAGASFTVGTPEPGAPLYLVEGIGQAWAIWQATGHAAICCFGWGNVATVARAIHERDNAARLVLVPDVGKEGDAEKIARELGCMVACLPEGLPQNFDCNDLAQRDGHDVLAELLEQAEARATLASAWAAGSASPNYEGLPAQHRHDRPITFEDDEEELPYATEMQLAEQFVEETKGVMLWTPGLDWMANRGTHWERDDTLWRYSAAKRVCRATASGLDNAKLQAKICSASTANAVINLARPELATPVEAWDAHPMLLNTPGGVFDLETGREVSREGLLFTQVAGVAPTTAATPTWDKFITDVFEGDAEMIEFIQRMGGYCLTGSIREQKLFFLHGVGANGKSVFLDVLRNIGGRYSHNLPSEALMTSRSEGHPTMFASLHGKRLAISSEIEESAHWAESRIKSLTGDETLTARYMRQDFFTFPISHKHVIAGNFKPRLKGDDFAMVRRMVLIPFLRKFEGANRDNDLPQKLRGEYSGILSWFIEGARKWARDGLAIPESVTEASTSYMAENNDLLLWLADCCKTGPGLTCTSSALYASFAGWKQGNGEHAPSVKAFSQRLERMFTKKRCAAGVVFEGLAVSSSTSTGAYSRASNGW